LYVELEVAGITEDGKTAAVGFHRKDKTWQVGMVSLETGKVTILRDTEWRDTYVGNFSPDGRWLVYATQLTKENDRDGAIYVVATDGSDHHPLVQHVLNLAPLFTPDGSRVVFRTSAPNNVDLSSIRVVDGKPVGSPELAKDGVGRPMGFTRDGSFYYYQSGGTREGVYTVDVSPAIWKIKSSPKQITSGLGGGLQGPPAWSPNGRLLAFAVRGTQTSGPRIVIHSFDASPERELSISRNALGRIEGWSEDGKSLVMAGGGKGLRLFDTDTQRDRVLMAPNEQGTDVSVTDGKVVFYPTFDGGLRQANTEAPPVRDTIRLRRRDLRTGDDRELYHEEFERSWRTVPALALSPDGHSLAYSIPRPDFKSTSLLVLPASGEAPRALPDIPMDSQVTWTPDSRALLFVRTSEIWVQPVDGSAAYSTGIHFSGIGSSLSVHPDGTRIAFIGSTPNRQVWAIKNLFSDTPAAK
jgi:Tol biopolymer transport system component